MAVRGIPTGKATPANLQAGLIAFLTGSKAATVPASAAYLAPDNDTLLDVYPNLTIPTPEVDNYDDLFRLGKGPLLVVGEPTLATGERYFGGEEETQRFGLQLVLLCRVFRTVSGVSQAATLDVDGPGTRRQLANCENALHRLLRYHGGQFPVYDRTLADPYTPGPIGYAEVSLLSMPVPQADQGRCLFQLSILCDTGTDG